jgi:hypothetical protein
MLPPKKGEHVMIVRKLIGTLATIFALGIGSASVAAAVPVTSLPPSERPANIKPLLTAHGALADAEADAYYFWAGEGLIAAGSWCAGPYENVRYKTQWACYGKFLQSIEPYWQVNLDPYGYVTYHHKSP